MQRGKRLGTKEVVQRRCQNKIKGSERIFEAAEHTHGAPVNQRRSRKSILDNVLKIRREGDGSVDLISKNNQKKLIKKNKRLQEKSTVGDTYQFGGNTVDFKAQQATTLRGEKIDLSKKEAMLLKLLIEFILETRWGKVFYKDNLKSCYH